MRVILIAILMFRQLSPLNSQGSYSNTIVVNKVVPVAAIVPVCARQQYRHYIEQQPALLRTLPHWIVPSVPMISQAL